MTAGLHALMKGVIDYAGLFPPAKLPMEEAVAEYLAIRESPEAWMLGRFVVPAFEAGQLEARADELSAAGHAFALALIGRRCDTVDDCCAAILEDTGGLAEFIHGSMRSRCDVSLELPLPADIAREAIPEESLSRLIEAIVDPPDEFAILLDPVFFEVPLGADAPVGLESLAKLLGEQYAMGLKCRTGGPTSDAFPHPNDLAEFIHVCRKHGCPWKATAGLHHPIRHTDAELGVKMHGFLNVLFAAVLSHVNSLPKGAIAEILADEDAANFQISDAGIRWRDYAATVDQIQIARFETFDSFGSCSFAAPRDDLKRLGLL